jgi:hypothetical protein
VVALLNGTTYTIGKLDATGRFTPDRKFSPMKYGSGGSGLSYDMLNDSPGPAYEYRSGRLILGNIDAQGDFIPDLGSKVIPFKDYRPGPDALPIYNLPGKFVRKDGKPYEDSVIRGKFLGRPIRRGQKPDGPER